MIEVVLNDRLGKKVRVKCNEDDTIGDLKKLVAAQTGTRADKIRIQKWSWAKDVDIVVLDDWRAWRCWLARISLYGFGWLGFGYWGCVDCLDYDESSSALSSVVFVASNLGVSILIGGYLMLVG
ncbi:hypothetical protein M5K25_021774 [Dendrobium thyrsiflorum]|uniref:Ubiquitin-like protein 5 n=1 Tax=Dendrobium thyrsiflorum TaxID=117978 RepID=A0ABD0U546_DENTH